VRFRLIFAVPMLFRRLFDIRSSSWWVGVPGRRLL